MAGNAGGATRNPAPAGQNQEPTSTGPGFNPFAGSGTTLGGSSDAGVFANYDHLDKPTGNLNDETLATVDDGADAGNVDPELGMTPFASSQFYGKEEKQEDDAAEVEDEDHITDF